MLKSAAFMRRFTMYLRLLAVAALTLGATDASARPVIPGGAGFGMDTLAGRGGKVYRVTNLNADGSGSVPDVLLPYLGGQKRIEKAA